MSELETGNDDELVYLSGEIAAAYVSHNALSPADLPSLLQRVHAALAGLNEPPEPVEPKQTAAVPIRKSVTPDAIVCLECGQPLKSLRRHLQASHDLSPEAYRERWHLPSAYPLVAPNYSARRSELAKSIGLGRKPGTKATKARGND